MWATVQQAGKYALPPQRILLHPVTWPAEGTYGTLGCFVTPITPPGDHLAVPHLTNGRPEAS